VGATRRMESNSPSIAAANATPRIATPLSRAPSWRVTSKRAVLRPRTSRKTVPKVAPTIPHSATIGRTVALARQRLPVWASASRHVTAGSNTTNVHATTSAPRERERTITLSTLDNTVNRASRVTHRSTESRRTHRRGSAIHASLAARLRLPSVAPGRRPGADRNGMPPYASSSTNAHIKPMISTAPSNTESDVPARPVRRASRKTAAAAVSRPRVRHASAVLWATSGAAVIPQPRKAASANPRRSWPPASQVASM